MRVSDLLEVARRFRADGESRSDLSLLARTSELPERAFWTVPNTEIPVVVKPWYRQFYVRRGGAEWLADQVSPEGYERGLEAIGGFAYVGTTMYDNPTKVVVRVHDMAPGPPDGEADRVAEACLAGSGDVAVLNWEVGDDAMAVVAVPSGPVAIRVSWHGTAAAAAHPDCDVGGEQPSPERLILDLGPSAM